MIPDFEHLLVRQVTRANGWPVVEKKLHDVLDSMKTEAFESKDEKLFYAAAGAHELVGRFIAALHMASVEEAQPQGGLPFDGEL
jgi:hypothetical protein